MKSICKSLYDLLGIEYISAVCEAQAFLTGKNKVEFETVANEKVDFFPECFQNRLDNLTDEVSVKVAKV